MAVYAPAGGLVKPEVFNTYRLWLWPQLRTRDLKSLPNVILVLRRPPSNPCSTTSVSIQMMMEALKLQLLCKQVQRDAKFVPRRFEPTSSRDTLKKDLLKMDAYEHGGSQSLLAKAAVQGNNCPITPLPHAQARQVAQAVTRLGLAVYQCQLLYSGKDSSGTRLLEKMHEAVAQELRVGTHQPARNAVTPPSLKAKARASCQRHAAVWRQARGMSEESRRWVLSVTEQYANEDATVLRDAEDGGRCR
ncbi:hypothetical protein VTK56DRAFT_9784 [Thermocarpiscus australiensis]